MRNHILIICSLVACLLSSCSENDYGSDSVTKDNSSGGMSIGVSLPSSTMRVTETADATKGLITTWESTDALQIFHKYTNNRTLGTMRGLTFASKGAGSSTTFTYPGTEEGNSLTPDNSLYAFNALPTAGNYTQTYNSSNDNFALSLSGYASQDGKVANLRNYDAMYGVSSVGSDGTPAAMGMNHLMSVVRFDLTNAAFTGTLTSVKFMYTVSSGSSLLPASGNFTLSNTGTVTTGTLTGATSWTVNNVAASSSMAPVYLMAFPDTRSGKLAILATDALGNAYYREITLSAFSLTSGGMKIYTVTLNPIATYTFKYYQWDATGEYPAANSTITSGVATNSCKDCPTYDQAQMYIGAGIYIDTTTPWKDATSGNVYKGGIWFKKKAYISGFDAGTATKSTTDLHPVTGTPPDASQYFYLPFAGFKETSIQYVGTFANYWISTANSDVAYGYRVNINAGGANMTGVDTRYDGNCVWPKLSTSSTTFQDWSNTNNTSGSNTWN